MNTTIITSDIDRLGQLLAQIADLQAQADVIKDRIKDTASLTGEKNFEGEAFKATYIESNRSSVDYKALTKGLGITQDQLVPYTKTTAVFSVKVTSR